MMTRTAPNPVRSPDPRTGNSYYKVWNVLAYMMLLIGVLFCLFDGSLQLNHKVIAMLLCAGYALWYWLFVMGRSRWDWSNGVMVASFIGAIAVSITLSWIHPAFLMVCFGFYGLTFGTLPLRWASALVVMLSLALAWRFVGFSGGLTLNSLPIIISMLLSGFFTVLLGLYIDSIVRQSRDRQRVINELEATRSELAQAERQAGILEDRQRRAGEIHDNLAQGFTSIVMYLEAAEQALENDPGAVRRYIVQARQAARQHLSEARSFLWALRPDVAAREPLALALGRVLQRWGDGSGVVHLETTGNQRPLPASIEATLLKAAQEALANVRKHAQASQVNPGAEHSLRVNPKTEHSLRVNLTLSYMEDEVILDVQDNGVGFDPARASAQAGPDHGYGLVSLRERVEQLGGRLEVESAPGEGTTLVVSLPAAADLAVQPAREE
jgi:signal transduction histidine kinase